MEKSSRPGSSESLKALEKDLSNAETEKRVLDASLSQLERDQQARQAKFDQSLKDLHSNSDSIAFRQQLLDAAALTNCRDSLLKSASASTDSLSKLMHHIATQDAWIKKLQFDLDVERAHLNSTRADNQNLKQLIVTLQANAEQEEEFISNKLLKRINNLKKEKTELLIKVEQEEEMITNTLQKKLTKLQKEKIDMEIALEQEQEFIVNRLQKQLEALRQQQNPTSSSGSSTPLHKPRKSINSPSLSSFAEFPPNLAVSPGMIEVVKAEATHLRNRLAEVEEEREKDRKKHQDEMKSLQIQLEKAVTK